MQYKCYKCFYITDRKSNLIKHFNNKKKCCRDIKCSYTDNEIKILNEKQINKDLKEDIEEDLKYLECNKESNEFICNHCNKKFLYNFNLTKHIKKFHIHIHETIINNIQINNINNINIIRPVPFDNEWDVSNINDIKKSSLIFSKIMYSKLLEEILKNEINLNVIIDKDSDSGLVYKNDIEKYIKMKLNDIIDSSMIKLNKHLNNFNKDVFDIYNSDKCEPFYFEKSKSIIDNKLENYNKDEEIQKIVGIYLSQIYEEKKDNAILLLKSDNTLENFGY